MMRQTISAIMVILSMAVHAASPEEVAQSAMDGFMLFTRDSLPDDRKTGYDLMLAAAWEGDAKAANNIGWLLQNGEYVDKDLKAALRWYERASDQGLPAAALNYILLILNHRTDLISGILPDRHRLADAATLAGKSLMMGRGLPYDVKQGEDMLLRGALWGNEEAALTIAQQLEMYPDSFSYLPLETIATECDALLRQENRNIPTGISAASFAEEMLTPGFWYARIHKYD